MFLVFFSRKTVPSPIVSKSTNSIQIANSSSCIILKEEYCRGGKVLEKQINGQKYEVIGFNLPSGAVIFSPVEGMLIKGKFSGSPFVGPFGLVKQTVNKSFYFVGDLQFDNNNTVDVKPGDVVAHIQKIKVASLEGYNFLIFAGRLDDSNKIPISDKEFLRTLFKNI